MSLHAPMLNRADGLGWPAVPLAWGYGTAVRARRWAYDRGLLKSHRAPLPAISVGGLEAGGSGKTPVTAWLLRRLRELGAMPGLLSRGYGRRSDGLHVLRPGEHAAPEIFGDEPAMLARSLGDLALAVCADRRRGAEALAGACNVIVLDDAFSHRRLARELDIVVLRGERPLGQGGLLPAGSLREPPSSLGRAHVVWLHHHGAPEPATIDLPAGKVIVVSRARATAPATLGGEPVDLRGARVLAVAGVARPAAFAGMLQGLGAEVVATRWFPDHHAFDVRDLVELAGLQRRHGANAIAITPKDAVKWPAGGDTPVWVVGYEVEVVSGMEALDVLLRQTLRRGIP